MKDGKDGYVFGTELCDFMRMTASNITIRKLSTMLDTRTNHKSQESAKLNYADATKVTEANNTLRGYLDIHLAENTEVNPKQYPGTHTTVNFCMHAVPPEKEEQVASYNSSKTGEILHLILSKLKTTIHSLSLTLRCQLEQYRPGWESLEIAEILSMQVTQDCINSHVCEIIKVL